ncbi:MAG: hypothetical protein ACR2MG_14375 [Pyrinomonadaceae bacterium]
MKASKISRRIILGLFVTLTLGLFIPQTVFCQTEKLGIVQYTPPQGMTKTPKENVVAFSETNQKTGSFCIITLYGATPGTGNAQSDFKREWNNLVVKTMKAEANPPTETQAADGWTVIGGASPVEEGVAFLTVFSGFGKTVSVLGVFNEKAYIKQIETFILGIDLDKTAAPTNTATVRNSGANQSNTTGKFGSMSYTAPAGWSEQKFSDGVVFKPLDLPANEHLAIQIMSPLNSSGTLEQALKQSFDEAAAMYNGTKMYQSDGNYSKNAAQKSFNGWEYIRGKGGLNVNGTETGLELFVVKINNRFERIAILESRPSCQTYSKRYYTSERVNYRNAIENLLFSIRFNDSNEPSLKSGSTKGSGIVGVWQGVIQGTGFAAARGLSIETFSAIFLDNGQVYFGPNFSREGFDGKNTRIFSELNQKDWKTYTYSNGRGNLKMIFGDFPFRIEGNNLIITKNQTDWKFYKLNGVDGATFNGTYAMSEVNGKIPVIAFTSDGRFNDNGALKVLYHEYIDCINPAAAPGSGTYEVKDYTIIFSYTDGRKIRLAFLGTEYTKGNPSPATLRMSYNEDKLIRQ